MRKWWIPFLIGGMAGFALGRRYQKKQQAIAWSVGDNLSQVVAAHADFLLARFPAYSEKFNQLVRSDREAAAGEAAVFALLKTYLRADPEPNDEPGVGGVDFICGRGTDNAFVVEVTSLKPEAVAKQSGIPVTADEGGAFRMTTRQLFSTVRDKADQLAEYPHPRVLAITSTHLASSFLLGTQGAENLLTSEPQITYPLAGSGDGVTMTTNLRSSIFFAPDANGNIVPRRQSVSAVLLIGLFDDQSHVVGLLHPAPARPLSIDKFREIPFLRVKDWPVADGAIRIEWVVPSPEAKIFPHAAVYTREQV
jgi:hypothetical protein